MSNLTEQGFINNFTSFLELSSSALPSKTRNREFSFQTPKFLVDNFGFKELDMVITEYTIRKIYNFHGVTIDFLKNLPFILDNSDGKQIAKVFKSNTQKNSRVVVSFEFVGKKPIIIAIAKNKRVNQNKYVNEIKSVYEKDNAEIIFNNWKSKNLLIYENPNKKFEIPEKSIIIKYKGGRT